MKRQILVDISTSNDGKVCSGCYRYRWVASHEHFVCAEFGRILRVKKNGVTPIRTGCCIDAEVKP